MKKKKVMKMHKKFWQIKNEAGSDRAEILLYGEINANAEFWKEWLGDDSMTSARGTHRTNEG